jgi:hypothetical protein
VEKEGTCRSESEKRGTAIFNGEPPGDEREGARSEIQERRGGKQQAGEKAVYAVYSYLSDAFLVG